MLKYIKILQGLIQINRMTDVQALQNSLTFPGVFTAFLTMLLTKCTQYCHCNQYNVSVIV